MVFDRHRVGRRRTPRPDHGHSHPGGARFHPNVRPRVLDRQRLEPRPSVGLRGGPVQSARGRLEPRRHPLGDDARRGPAVRPRGDLRSDHPRPRTGGRRDDGRHHDDREPQRDFHLPLRPGTDHRELDCEQLLERHRPAGAECPHRTGTRPHADVAPHQRLRSTHAGPGPSTRGGRRVRFPFDRDARRRWKDLAMNVAAFLCVVLALIPLGSLLFEASVRGLRSITPGFFTLTTANGGIGNAIQGTLILIALTAVIALPVGILTGIYLAEYGKNRLGAAVRFFVDVMTQIPSIVVGIFAFSLILELGATGIVSQRLVFSTTTGVIALSTIMIPFVARTSEEALRLVPISTRESALALGIPRYRAILRVVLPSSSSAVITGALLGIARVGGETAPLLMTCLGSPFWWQGLDQPCESLPHTIYVFALGPDSALNQAAWGASLILVLMMLGIAIVSRVVIRLRSVSR